MVLLVASVVVQGLAAEERGCGRVTELRLGIVAWKVQLEHGIVVEDVANDGCRAEGRRSRLQVSRPDQQLLGCHRRRRDAGRHLDARRVRAAATAAVAGRWADRRKRRRRG